jgi:hypothetical protein
MGVFGINKVEIASKSKVFLSLRPYALWVLPGLDCGIHGLPLRWNLAEKSRGDLGVGIFCEKEICNNPEDRIPAGSIEKD